MLLKKLNVLYEQVITEAKKKDTSIDPSCQEAAPNKSLAEHDQYFEDGDKGRAKKPQVPDEFAGKVANFKGRSKKIKPKKAE